MSQQKYSVAEIIELCPGMLHYNIEERMPSNSPTFLYRIRAERDIPLYRVREGDIGGLVSGSYDRTSPALTGNLVLSHRGNSWVDEDSIVIGGKILDSALVSGGSQVMNVEMRHLSRIEDSFVRARFLNPEFASQMIEDACIASGSVIDANLVLGAGGSMMRGRLESKQEEVVHKGVDHLSFSLAVTLRRKLSTYQGIPHGLHW